MSSQKILQSFFSLFGEGPACFVEIKLTFVAIPNEEMLIFIQRVVRSCQLLFFCTLRPLLHNFVKEIIYKRNHKKTENL